MSDVFRPPEENFWQRAVTVTKQFPNVFKFLWEVSPLLLMGSIVGLIITAIIPAALIWMTKVIIDQVLGVIQQGGEFAALTIPIAIMVGLWLGQSLVGAVTGYIDMLLGERSYSTAADKLMKKATALDVAFFESPRFYDQLHHARRQLWNISSLGNSTLGMLQTLVGLGAMFGLLSLLHPLAIVVLMVTTLPRIFVEGWQARKSYDLHMEMVRQDRIAEYGFGLTVARDPVKEIRLFGLIPFMADLFHINRDKWISAYMKLQILFMKINLGFNSVSFMGVASVWLFAVYQAVNGHITIGELTMVFTAAQSASQQLNGLMRSGGFLYQNALFASRFFGLLELDPQDVDGALEPPRSDNPRSFPERLRNGIEFNNVSFHYPNNEELVLKNLSFKIPAGGKVAIVGENGAGKTTIIKLLNRFYDPVEGEILIDGVDAREFDPKSIQQHMAAVFQDFVRYDISAAENIGVGDVNRIDDLVGIKDAAEKGGADKVIEQLPKGYETILGRTLDEGVDLSGGEWQQLGISRAFMSDSQILILDEPTAALDAFKEHQLYERIAELSEYKTLVFISHRFSTVRMADAIVVVEQGEAIEAGSHQELIALDGKYAAMFNTQASRYTN